MEIWVFYFRKQKPVVDRKEYEFVSLDLRSASKHVSKREEGTEIMHTPKTSLQADHVGKH